VTLRTIHRLPTSSSMEENTEYADGLLGVGASVVSTMLKRADGHLYPGRIRRPRGANAPSADLRCRNNLGGFTMSIRASWGSWGILHAWFYVEQTPTQATIRATGAGGSRLEPDRHADRDGAVQELAATIPGGQRGSRDTPDASPGLHLALARRAKRARSEGCVLSRRTQRFQRRQDRASRAASPPPTSKSPSACVERRQPRCALAPLEVSLRSAIPRDSPMVDAARSHPIAARNGLDRLSTSPTCPRPRRSVAPDREASAAVVAADVSTVATVLSASSGWLR